MQSISLNLEVFVKQLSVRGWSAFCSCEWVHVLMFILSCAHMIFWHYHISFKCRRIETNINTGVVVIWYHVLSCNTKSPVKQYHAVLNLQWNGITQYHFSMGFTKFTTSGVATLQTMIASRNKFNPFVTCEALFCKGHLYATSIWTCSPNKEEVLYTFEFGDRYCGFELASQVLWT